jgi:hypothetical protein
MQGATYTVEGIGTTRIVLDLPEVGLGFIE